MSKGWRFPDLEQLEKRLARLRWSREDLARAAGITTGTAGRLLAGRAVAIETIERVTSAVVSAEPPAAALALQEAS